MYEKTELARVLADLKSARASIDLQIVRIETLIRVIGDDDKPTLSLVSAVYDPLEHDPLLAEIVNQSPTAKVEVVKVEEPLVINEEWKRILDLMNNGTENLFITGEAGTGKSTLLRHFVDHCDKNIAVVAPTGVAALRVGAETIHRFLKIKAGALEEDLVKLKDAKKYKNLDILIVDEISMVRADLMDLIDKFLRMNGKYNDQPFGGTRIIMFGDLFQLPPVAKSNDKVEQMYLNHRYGTGTPYFFHAECWRDKQPKICELTTIFRQKDSVFTGALNAIRRGDAGPEHLKLINDRVQPTFKPTDGELWLTLTTTNDSADMSNQRMLRSLNTPSKVFEALVVGDFNLRDAPTDEFLELKAGAVVMFIRNDPMGNWVNGTLGKVTKISPLIVDIDGKEYEVDPVDWESIAYEYDETARKLTKHIKGGFTQIPLKLANAITIHKGQGMTYDRVIIDMSRGAFTNGQTYVALSRCRTLEGMILRNPIAQSDLMVSTEVQAFMAGKPIAKPAAMLL